MAQHVNTEESAAHAKHIITVQPQLPAPSPLFSSYQIVYLRGEDTVVFNATSPEGLHLKKGTVEP